MFVGAREEVFGSWVLSKAGVLTSNTQTFWTVRA
jgi:hypothetical protein